MIAIRKRPGEAAELIEIRNELRALQKEVGGYIQAFNIAEDAAIICDEEGRLKGYEPNCDICGIDFVGTILVVGTDGENFCSIKEPEQVRKLIFGKYDYLECLELVVRDDGTWEIYDNYTTIHCESKEDFDRLSELVKTGERMRWRAADTEWPTDEMLLENNEFLVMIKGAANPTTLLLEKIPGEGVDEDGNAYIVEWWMPLPEAPKKEEE